MALGRCYPWVVTVLPMMDGNSVAQLQCLGRSLLYCFSLADMVHFHLVVFLPLISGYTAAVYHYPPTITSGLENLSSISIAQLRLLSRFGVYS